MTLGVVQIRIKRVRVHQGRVLTLMAVWLPKRVGMAVNGQKRKNNRARR
jgi:hypothetical protein